MSNLHQTTSNHLHRTLSPIDALNFPANTEGGPISDEYVTTDPRGFVLASEEDADSAQTRVHSGSDIENNFSEKDIKLVVFTPGDKEDPRNWGKGIKWIRTIAAALACLSVALGSSIVVMDMPVVAESLHTNTDVVHLTVMLFVLGFGLGPLFFSPLSELFGRQPIYFVSLGLYFAFDFLSTFARNPSALVIGRLLAGISASAPMCIIGGSIADMWHEEERGMPMAIFSATVFMGPIFGPVIAGFLSSKGWRANYYLLTGFTGLVWITVAVLLPETYAVVILRRKAAKLRKETGDSSYMTEQERFKKPLSEMMKHSIILPLKVLFTEPIVFAVSIYLSLVYSLLYLFFFAYPIIFGELHNFSLGMVGVSFISILVGMLLVFASVMPWQTWYYAKVTAECKEKGIPVPPETRLPSMMIGSIILPIGLFIFAFTSYSHVHWIAPMIGGALFGFGMIAIYIGANSYVIDSFPSIAASAMAAKTLLSRVCGSTIPMFVDRFYHSELGPPLAGLIVALASLIMVPIPFVFYFYGAKIRGMSKNASSK